MPTLRGENLLRTVGHIFTREPIAFSVAPGDSLDDLLHAVRSARSRVPLRATMRDWLPEDLLPLIWVGLTYWSMQQTRADSSALWGGSEERLKLDAGPEGPRAMLLDFKADRLLDTLLLTCEFSEHIFSESSVRVLLSLIQAVWPRPDSSSASPDDR